MNNKKLGWRIYNALRDIELAYPLDKPLNFNINDLKNDTYDHFKLGEGE